LLNHFLRSAIDWIFRRRSLGYALVRLGVVLLGALLVGLTVGIRIPTAKGPLVFDWSTYGGTSETISWIIVIVAALLISAGLLLIRNDWQKQEREKVIVIEARGLRDWQGEPLVNAVPAHLRGRRDPVVLDVRQGLVDGQIVDPRAALDRIVSLPHDLARRCDGLDRSDITFVLGGLAPVPLLFLLGLIVDDEGRLRFMDWDRHARRWRALDSGDDGKRFAVTGADKIAPETRRVALCISASYDVFDADIASVEPGVPIVRMDLEDRCTDSHWFEEKQQALGRQFLDLALSLAALGVKEIALFLAAPASLSVRLGALYDKRNLPQIEVNQYERGNGKIYPWAVRMPVSGRIAPELLLR